ncbi:alpha/beta hydrolase family protein [Gordonia phosphorivorans]|uniref:Alpha/beta hydrolase family protein n=1 Tax=Gordonia phosphorivorans TaxID=1056982 RepID=A0ABV6HBN1_9ACTN
MKRRKLAYGDHPSQFGHLYLPDVEPGERARLIVMIHGGSWSTEFGLTIAGSVSRDLAQRGAVVWNLEYRRVEEGGGWPQTGRDVLAALRLLDEAVSEELALAGIVVDKQNVAVVGHSAGGQLAAWAVARLGARTQRYRFTTVIPQSAVLDLTLDGICDKPSVTRFLGASYDEAPQRYLDASPAHAPVVDVLIAVVHTTEDRAVPVELSRHYVDVMRERGQRVTLTEVPGDHAAFLDLSSRAHRQTLRELGL